jgi:hypothetical protein
MKNPPDFPSHLSYPPNHPAGNNWQYRGNKWSPGKVIPVYAVTDGGSWSICENKEPSGYFLHYAELVPLPAEPDYASREYQLSVIAAALDKRMCQFEAVEHDGWIDEPNAWNITMYVWQGIRVRIKPSEPVKPETVPLEAGDVPPGSAIKDTADCVTYRMVTGTNFDGVYFGEEYQTFDSLQKKGRLILRPGSSEWTHCEKEAK